MHSFSRTRLSLTQLEDRLTPNAYTVTTTSDVPVPNRVTLREAILAANIHSNALNVAGANDVIQFAIPLPQPVIIGTEETPPPPPPPGAPSEIILQLALPTITEGVNITGAGSGWNQITIRRDGNASPPFRILTIDTSGQPVKNEVNLVDLRLAGGYALGAGDAGNGGGIWSKGTQVDLKNVFVTGNTASGDGGGIWAIGVGLGELFTIQVGSRVELNSATNGGGAAVKNIYFRVFDTSAVFSNTAAESGGGIAAYADNYANVQLVEVKNGRVENNHAGTGDGGGIFVDTVRGPMAAVMLRAAKINGNTVYGERNAAGGIVGGGHGGAIACFRSSVTDDLNTEVKHNREGVASVPIGGMWFDIWSLRGIGLGTYEDNVVW